MGSSPWEESKMAEISDECERLRPSAEAVKTWRADDQTTAAERPLRVLIVDDNADLTYMMSELIDKCGHDVRVAGDGPTALQTAATFHPDVMFVDIAMPKMDGFRVANEIRRSSVVDDCLLIAVTGYGNAAHHTLGMQAGFDHYVVKPVAFRTLSELLLLARHRLVRSVEAQEITRKSIGARASCLDQP